MPFFYRRSRGARFWAMALIPVLLMQVGCASIISQSDQSVRVRSEPSGAAVEIGGMRYGTTPVMAKLRRKDRHEIKVTKEGYYDETRLTSRGFNWWFMGNIILGGIIGIVIDFATGAVYTVEPDEINVRLEQNPDFVASASSEVSPAIAVAAQRAETVGVSSSIASVEKLAELKEKGYITEEEFQIKKKELLGL